MPLNDDIWEIINDEEASVYRQKNKTRYRKRKEFKGISIDSLREITDITDNSCFNFANKNVDIFERLPDQKVRVKELLEPVIKDNIILKGIDGGRLAKVKDTFSMIGRGTGLFGYGGYGGFGGSRNYTTASGVYGADPSRHMEVTPNLWLSPSDVVGITSQKGVPGVILDQKALQLFENGISINNSKLSEKQNEKIKEAIIETKFSSALVRAVYWSLAYGGSLIYPVFDGECPFTLGMDPIQLHYAGFIRKGCIERWVVLDRWSTIHVPQWNPTEKDFLHPEKYFIPYLGADLNGKRASRVITGALPGYFGNIMTLGWGLSDLIGWYMAAFSYNLIAETIPNMINQLSMVVRSVDMASLMSMNSVMDTEKILSEATAKMRESSVANDPITMDALGELKTIDRRFDHVDELIRLSRQHFCAQAGIPEETIFSVERGSFSSGNIVEGATARMQQNTRLLYHSISEGLRNVVNYLVVHALGTDPEILSVLKYNVIQFHDPRVIAADTKADIFSKVGDAVFQLVSAQVPMAEALRLAKSVGGNDLIFPEHYMEKLEKAQKTIDKRAEELHNAEVMNKRGASESSGAKDHTPSKNLQKRRTEKVSELKTFKIGEKREKHGS